MPSQASSVADKLSAIAASNSDLTIDERETCNRAALLLSETGSHNGWARSELPPPHVYWTQVHAGETISMFYEGKLWTYKIPEPK